MRERLKKINIVELFTYIILFCIPLEPLIGKTYNLLVYIYIVISIVKFLTNKLVKITMYDILFICFIILGAISSTYSIHIDSTTSMTRQLIVNFLLAFSIAQNIQKTKDEKSKIEKFENSMKCFQYGTILITIYLIIFELPKMGKWDRLGENLYENYGSYMVYSYCLIISMCFTIWDIFFYRKKDIKIKYSKLIILFILIYACMISGTRKSLICPVIFSACYVILQYRKKYGKLVIGIITIFILSVVVYQISMKNQELYYLVGRRIESMIQQVFEDKQADGSIEERQILRILSIKAYNENPIAGIGLHAFREYSYLNGGPYLYSHCNYTELLADLGIIGFFTYYVAYILIIITAVKKKNDKELALYIIAFMVMNLISDYSSVTYYRHYYLIIFFMFEKYLTESKEKKNG